MHDFNNAIKECLEEVKETGVEVGKISKFLINTRAKRWGICKRENGEFEIEISDALLDDSTPIISLKSTIIHEILHTCQGCQNHGSKWKSLANKMNSKYGYNIK